MDTVIIRSYTTEDYFSVKETLIEGELFDKTWDAEAMLTKRITDKPDSIVVAVINDEVIGCIYLIDDVLPFVFRLVVKKQFRRQGIGKMLIQEASKRLKEHGHTELALLVDDRKERLKNWYKEQGFQQSEKTWRGFWKKL